MQTVWYLVLEYPDRRVEERVRDVQREFEREFPGRTLDLTRLVFKIMPGFDLTNGKMWTWFELELQSSKAAA